MLVCLRLLVLPAQVAPIYWCKQIIKIEKYVEYNGAAVLAAPITTW